MTDNYQAAERIMQVYDETKLDGTLVIPAFDNATEGMDRYLSCKMIWTKDDAVSLCGEINDLIDHFRNLSGRFSELDEMDEEQLKNALPKEELDIWFTYRPLYLHDLYYDQVQEIFAKEEMIDEAQSLMQKQAAGEELDEDEQFIVNVYGHDCLTDEETEELERYRNIDVKESEMRVGKGMFACRVVEGGTRIIKCMALNAPKIIVDYAVSVFVKAVILHRFCRKCVLIDGK